jgi:isopenicillin-N epimerase
LKELFEDDLSIIYLNSGTQSRTPLDIIHEVNSLRKTTYTNPTAMHVLFPEALYKAHLQFSSFINSKPDDLFFCHNVTEALNHFILGTDLEKGAEIILFDLEYGATFNICKHRADKENRELQIVNISQYFKTNDLSEEEINSKIMQAIDTLEAPKGSMFIMSHVITTNGHILPIQKISEQLKSKSIISIVDGAHAIGAFENDFSLFSSIDFYGGNLHKWLMGLPGTGFGWINPDSRLSDHTLMVGWPNNKNATHLDDFQLTGTALKYYLKGTIDFAPFMAISKLVEWWVKHTPEKIYELRRVLRQRLIQGLSKNSQIELMSSQVNTSPLLSYRLSKKYSSKGSQIAIDLFEKDQLSIASPIMNGETVLRLSPNVYNSEIEIDKACDILNDYLK